MDIAQLIVDALPDIEIDKAQIEQALEQPKDPKHGDKAFPCFLLAKKLQKPPQQVAQDLAKQLPKEGFESITAMGPFLNFMYKKGQLAQDTLEHIKQTNFSQPKQDTLVVIESPSPNTNKPLHLGHLRNMLLAQSIKHVLEKTGKQVKLVNVSNDRGIHICKSMLAYQKFGEGKTPKEAMRKSDHFVGDYYVKYAEEEKIDPLIETEAREMLRKWEANDRETLDIWKQMNQWAYDGWKQTYQALEFTHDKEYFESETYKYGRDIILEGVQNGIFYRDESGAVMFDLEDKGLGKKVLLRADGTSVYITQDIYMAHKRHEEFNFNEMIYVVGNEQEYHFQVLFEVFKALGWSFAEKCVHFSYGMIELPEGKMKSREGTIVDTDDLLEQVIAMAREGIRERDALLPTEELDHRANAVGQAAIRFFMLKHDPLKNMTYDPKSSLSFEGETGPYVQYTYARIASILRKADKVTKVEYSLLNTEEERELIILLKEFDATIQKAAKELKPSLIAHYLIRVAKKFNVFYSANKVIQEDKNLQNARVALLQAVNKVLKEGLSLLHIQTLEQM